jgi:hypothetical protein
MAFALINKMRNFMCGSDMDLRLGTMWTSRVEMPRSGSGNRFKPEPLQTEPDFRFRLWVMPEPNRKFGSGSSKG